MRLQGRAALVTGGSRGIGRAIALALAKEGADVLVNYRTNAAAADEVVAAIRALGRRAIAAQRDVREIDSHGPLVGQTVREFGRIDILVNNAGMSRRQPFLEATEDAWEEVTGINLKGPYFLAQAAARQMRTSGGGKVVNISSVHDRKPMQNNSIYCIAKAGLVMMTRALAVELAPANVQVNCVSPGAILTDENRERLEDPEFRARLLTKIPAARIGSVDDVTGAVVLLASTASDYMTGTTVYVDGGMVLGS